MSGMLVSDETSLRAYLGRILGWSAERTQAIDHALRSIDLSVTHRATLVLLGEADMVPIAYALHRRTIGVDRPFVLCDPRTATNYTSGVAAFEAARGGSLCVRHGRRPLDFERMVVLVRDPDANTQIIICADVLQAMHPFLIRPVPIRVPALRMRARELPRIVDEYAADAISMLGADAACFTGADRRWVLDHATGSLTEIEKATERVVAFRMSANLNQAAKRLGMSMVALKDWLGRRGQWPAQGKGAK